MSEINLPDLGEALRAAASLDDLYGELAPMNLTPGWIDRELPLFLERKPALIVMHRMRSE
jgi:hypothetical protein